MTNEADIEAMAEAISIEMDNIIGQVDALVNAFYAACPDNYFLNANYPREGSDKVVGELERLRAENARMRELLVECAGDLEAEINVRYFDEYGNVHPAMRQKYLRDMTIVIDAKKALQDKE